ncbi:GCN5 family acetyltransferase [Saccharothrix sp. NRRL B-16348]|uniref:GNAT family N-acetyltransferase n=1 Tax=Saccharothrix sp. NRRL B-16348 TaxID=1415542 RepID=UPI0006B052E7|nr:GNAT family N-acetyltransferase [Saccharothrix sp. NRRL B-16348]KOX33214.1 GCN5 family acetyltransferase [Saccharothrix sp. NRRL B-16348]
MDTTPKTWRLRVELDDSPGALARVTVRLAHQDCNVLALSVMPVPGGVLDELVVQAGPGVLPADLVDAVRAEGGRCVGITAADVRDLVDAPTAALRAAARALRDPSTTAEALRTVLGADSVTIEPDDAEPVASAVLQTTSSAIGGAAAIKRGWAPFTQVELARGEALIDLLSAAGVAAPRPTALLTDDGMALVLRPGRAGDEEAVAELHSRCSMGTLFNRYHSGMRTVPRRWLHRLLSPPRGSTVVAQCADRVVAMGQLIPMSTPDSAEVSLLVEDGWQGRGVGTALLGSLAGAARAAGYRELVGWCLPAETGLVRTAARAGLPTSVRREDGLLRVSIAADGPRVTAPGPVESASRQVASG